MRVVAMIQTADDSGAAFHSGADNWRAQVTVDSRGAGFRDLIIKSSGVRSSEKFQEGARYKFNGSECALAP
jgi:microcompartment protein CcmK/EutM